LLEISRDFQIFPNLTLIADANPIRRFTSAVPFPSSVIRLPNYTNSLTCSNSCSSSFTFIRSQLFPIVMTFVFWSFILRPNLLLLWCTLSVICCKSCNNSAIRSMSSAILKLLTVFPYIVHIHF